jgi:uncharacterized sodium:solute symporter family permease YidK
MLRRIKLAGTSLAMAGSLAAGSIFMTAGAAGAQPVVTGGLVNVTVTDVIDDVTVVVQDVNVGVSAALALAANVCDVNVNVLARQLRGGEATCENAVDDTAATITQI